MELAQARKIDAILATELSRWGRSTQDLLDAPQGRIMANMLVGTAWFERDQIRERVKSGLAAAKARGKRARPAARTPAPVGQTRSPILKAANEERSCHRIARNLGISRNNFATIGRRRREGT